MFIDDMAAKGPLRISDAEEAQRTLCALRVSCRAGELVLAGRGDDFV